MNCLDQGKGPPVLLIHAFPLNQAMWEPQLAPLSKAFRVLAPDIRGFGASQPASPWTMEEMADELNGLLEELGIDHCTVAGVSMGGYIALSFWTKYPNGFAGWCCRTRGREPTTKRRDRPGMI